MNSSQRFWIRVGSKCEAALRGLLLLLLGMYRTIGTAHLGGACRFEPSCSEYAVEAVRIHPPVRAVSLVIRRLGRCRPGGDFGYDPVPPRDGYERVK